MICDGSFVVYQEGGSWVQPEALSPNAEKLLQEILYNRDDYGKCKVDYWNERFDGLDFAKDSQLRSIFKELSDAEMIAVNWASSRPYDIIVLNNGLSYFDIKQSIEKEEKKDNRARFMRDILMIVIGAIIGGVVEFILFRFFGIGG